MAALLAAGCGGRVAHPLPAETALDDRLTCAHILGELENNKKRLVELEGEKKQSSANNAGLLLTSPLFLDTQKTFKTETAALKERIARLNALSVERGCAPVEPAPTAAESPDPQP
jgi:hypothetical protein